MASKEFFAKVRSWGESRLGEVGSAVKAALVSRWLELTGQLGSSLEDYQRAMQVGEEPGVILLSLSPNPPLARLVENGQAPYDMRETLLKSSTKSVRRARDGHLYLYVPLRKTTRGIIGLGGNAAMRAAKALAAYPADRLPAGLAPKIAPYHATDPLDSLVRMPAPGGRGSTYMTWRTISQIGRPWFHPGIRAHRFMDQVKQEAQDIADRVVRDRG